MIHHGDCLEVMAGLEPESVDAIVTDPPYDLTGHRWDSIAQGPNPKQTAHVKGRGGFMGKAWDGTGIAFRVETWAAMLRVAKPSAYLLAFGGTRTVHRMTVAIEDAGWIIRDMLVWAYASGFPKSKASLKPAWEPIVMARKPGPLRMLAVDACRIPGAVPKPGNVNPTAMSGANGVYGLDKRTTRQAEWEPTEGGRWPANVILTATEWYSLRDDVDQSARECITAYFEAQGVGVDDVPRVRQGVRDHARVGQGWSPEVLLPTMQLEGVTGGEANGHPSPTRVDPADEGRDDGTLPRGELTGLEGREVPRPERLRVGVTPDPDGAGIGTGRGDDDGQVRSGASAGHGDDAGPPAGAVRGGPSPQRDQGRQPADQPVPPGPVEPHAGASDGGPRTGTAPRTSPRAGSRERGVTVPLALIPDGWRQYFRFSHDSGIFDGGWEGVVGGGEAPSAGVYRKPDEPKNRGGRGGATGDGIFEAWSDGRRDNSYANDSGTYSRFFLVPKASRSDREPILTPDWFEGTGRVSTHPTVKPIDLMRHLVRLVTPTGGTVLDPFLGSGTTAIAAEMEGFQWIGIEKEAEYVAIAEARLNGTQRGLGLPA